MTIPPGTMIGHYRIVAPLGAGGMGEVCLAEDTHLERRVALKLLPREFAANPERMSRFVREAKSASALNHPNILTIHEIGESDGHHYISTEHIAGETLRRRLERGALPLAEGLGVAAQIASALVAAHEAGIVHRDIKPENVMIRSDGLVKVLDFGLVKVMEGPSESDGATQAATATQPGFLMGTIAYMSPEQSRGKPVDARSDLWSLGVVLYEMLSGQRPFRGDSPTDILVSILQDPPPRLDTGTIAAPAEICELIDKALAKSASTRHQTAREFLADLRSLQKRLELDPDWQQAPAPAVTRVGPAQDSQSASSSSSGARHAIAVLPFRNMSADAENEYFCDGLAEELLNALAKVGGLRVAARSSAFAFKGRNTTTSEIGRALGVTTLLEGSVRRAGSRLRISAQLVNAADGYQIWSERYDRELQDIFEVQDEITLAIVDALRVQLFGDARVAALRRGTEDPEAYQHYLKGRFHWNKRTRESLTQAAECYRQAIDRDPNYALAHAGLAECYVLFGWLSVESPRESMPRAHAAARRALELDETLPEAHAALGVYYSFYAWDQPAAVARLRRAIELNANYATAYHWLGNIPLLALGRFDDSIAAIRRAEALDPLSPIIRSDLGVTLLSARRYDEAIACFQKALAFDSSFYVARYHLGLALHGKGDFEAAISEYLKCLATEEDPWVRALLARSLVEAGRRDEALTLRDRLESESAHRYVPNVAFAVLHAAIGDREGAFTWLERDFAERSLFPPFYEVETALDDLRADPRFDRLVRRVQEARLDSAIDG